MNLRQGRTGEEWRESTRTPAPVDLNTAATLYELAVLERQAQGFIDPGAPTAPAPVAPAIAPSPVSHSPAPRSPADAALLGKLEKSNWRALSQHLRNRTIWRIGERRVREAVPQLVELIQQGNPMQDYCIAWTIGRCGDAGAAVAMQELHRRGTTDPVRRMAHQAWLLLADKPALQLHAEKLIAAWPVDLQSAWADRNDDRILNLASQEAAWGTLSRSDWLEQLDQVALCDTMARGILLALLSRIALRAGTFRAIRHIYKAAELRADAELFGLLHQRFETTKQTTSQTIVYARRSYVPFAKEAAQPDSSVAYSLRTRLYLLRRGWRTLRRLGEAADPAYITMAVGAMGAMDDNDAGKPYTRADRHFDRYSHWMLYNCMLRAHGPWRHSTSGRSWYQTGSIAPAVARQEAFPHLWDTRPDALHALLRGNRCEGVHEFAARALIDNTEYCATLPLDSVRELLRSHYTATAHFAYQVARQRIEINLPSSDWLMILLQARLPEARQYAVDCILRDPLRHAADALLVATMLCSPDEAVRRHGWLLCQCVHSLPGQADAVAMQILDWLDNCSDVEQAETTVPDIAADLLRVIEQALRAGAADVPYTRLLALAAHRLAAVRALACHWLLIHAVPPSAIPGATLAALLQDADVAVRSAAVRLFGALPDQVLAAQADLIAVFCTSPDASMRRAIDALVQRLPASHPDLQQQLLTALIDALFRSETGEGLHADLIAWITGPFKDAESLRDRALLLRLLAARSKGAQQLGAALLPAFTPDQFDIAAWSSFGRNQNATVRQWAFAAFSAHPERARAHLEDALRLFDSRFDDSLEFAASFFGQCCSHEDWTPLLLVNLCDHLTPAVQRLGRQMIATHFDIADVTDFMFKLSQHPSANMQLFVSNWLESACAGDLVKLQRLESYFLTVLSQVNRGRVVKSRVQSFLREQAMQSEAIAAFVARVFARQVLTVAIADKAAYIEGLREIRAHFPALDGVMTIHPPRAAARDGGAA